MAQYKPDGWVIIQLSESDYRVFGSWRGSYLSGDSWRVNSGIDKVTETEDAYFVYGESGSVYECDKRYYGCSSFYNSSVVASILDREIKAGRDAKLLSEDEAVELFQKFIE